jgi:molecular chaperone GrpE
MAVRMGAAGEEKQNAELERLRGELRREHDALLRALADFENYRRRMEREQDGAARRGKREVILPLLEVVDDFERALEHLPNAPPAMAAGVQALHRKLLGLLAAQGVSRFDSVGEDFDPRAHEALGTVATDDVSPGMVAETLQHGYRWNDEVLRPARVRVAE